MTKNVVYIGSTPQNLTEQAYRVRRREQFRLTDELLQKLQANSMGIKKM